jgi:hypothetical protein
MDFLLAGIFDLLCSWSSMPGDCPAVATPPALRLWKTFRSMPNTIPPEDTKLFSFPAEWRSLSDRNAVRNHNGMLFGFRPESRSPSTGFPSTEAQA